MDEYSSIFEFIEANPDVLFRFILYWIGFFLVISITYRSFKIRKQLKLPRHAIRFQERWASGRSLSNFFSQYGGARNALKVTVGDGMLVLRAMFPFNLLFIVDASDLEHDIPLDRIQSVSKETAYGRKVLRIRFYNSIYDEKVLELFLRKEEQFLQAIGRVLVEE